MENEEFEKWWQSKAKSWAADKEIAQAAWLACAESIRREAKREEAEWWDQMPTKKERLARFAELRRPIDTPPAAEADDTTARDESIRREAKREMREAAAVAICSGCANNIPTLVTANTLCHDWTGFPGQNSTGVAALSVCASGKIRALPIDTPPAAERARVWKFERYRDGLKMAEGAIVHAATEDEAIEKARNLFQKDAPNSTFKLVSPAAERAGDGHE
jgi:hypothetical protein